MAFGLPRLSTIIDVARRVDRLSDNVEKTQKALEVFDQRLRAVEDRMVKLEANQANMVVEARAAAGVAASSAALQHLVDMSRRIGTLEAGQNIQKRLE